jgi:hypothetical protein
MDDKMRLFVFLILIFLSFPVHAQHIDIGYAKDSTNITEVENEYHVNFTHQLIYQKINSLDYNQVKRILDTGNGCIINIEFMNNANDPANLKDISSGKYDKQLLRFLSDAEKDGRYFQIRTLHEFNGDWYPWCIYRTGNNLTEFHNAWNHVTEIIHDSDANVEIQLNYNQVSAKQIYSFKEMYPGHDNVDKIVITTYNRAGTDDDHKQWNTFKDNFHKPYAEITSFTSKPIGIAEISTTSYGGNKPLWLLQTTKDIKEYDRIVEVTWFLNNKEVNGIIWNWDMNNVFDKWAFRIANNKII